MSREPSRHDIWKMFDAIARTYDRANRAMTFGCDKRWRKALIKHLPEREHLHLLDCATGTGDQLLACFKGKRSIASAIGIDLSEKMLHFARAKMLRHPEGARIQFLRADVLDLPFQDKTFDAVTMAFGIRNVIDVERGLAEIARVLKPSGRVLVLEGSLPESRWIRPLHLFYLRHVLPRIGKFISKHDHAYRYLNETIETFPSGKAFCALMEHAGFCRVRLHAMMLGSVSLYVGEK